MATKKEIQKYVDMPWSYTVEQEEGHFIVYVNELPGVCTDAKTISQAVEEIKDAIYASVELYIDQGKEIPTPMNRADFNGRIDYHTSAERNYMIAKLAQQKHRSLSKILDMLVDAGLGQTRLPSR
jgi:predicted RNase H-like HicB family nuclease